MRPENTPIGVYFVNNNITQAAPEATPLPMIREHGEMEHVGIADKNVGRKIP
jgi:hypothetical protein